jgi:hypothetical protein
LVSARWVTLKRRCQPRTYNRNLLRFRYYLGQSTYPLSSALQANRLALSSSKSAGSNYLAPVDPLRILGTRMGISKLRLPRDITLNPDYKAYADQPHPKFGSLPLQHLVAIVHNENDDEQNRAIATVHMFSKIANSEIQLHTLKLGENPRISRTEEYHNTIPVIATRPYERQVLPLDSAIYQPSDGDIQLEFYEDDFRPEKLVFFFKGDPTPVVCFLGSGRYASDDGYTWRMLDTGHDGTYKQYLYFKFAAPADIEGRHPITIRFKNIDIHYSENKRVKLLSVSVPCEAYRFAFEGNGVVGADDDRHSRRLEA